MTCATSSTPGAGAVPREIDHGVYGLTVGMNRSIDGGSTRVLLARFDPAEVREAFERAAGGLVVEGYGLTEAAPVTHGNPLGRTKNGPIGVPGPDTDADDEANRLLPPGCMGELVVRGPRFQTPPSCVPTLDISTAL
jgi:acyl-coenzyme A synthetase/AMP-(fatty) acid ligase